MPTDKARKMGSGTLSLEVMDTASSKSYVLVHKNIQILFLGKITSVTKFRRVQEKAAKH